MTRAERVVVNRASGAWHWRYEQLDGAAQPLVLPAAEGFVTEAEAVAAARTAFPDVPLEVERDARTLARLSADRGGRAVRSVVRHRRLALGVATGVVVLLLLRRHNGLRRS